MGLWLILAAALAVAPQGNAVGARLDQAAAAIDDARYDEALTIADSALKEKAAPDADLDWASYLKARALAGLGRRDAAEEIVRARYRQVPSAYGWASIVSILTVEARHRDAASEILKLSDATFDYVNRLRPSIVEEILATLERNEDLEDRDKLVTRLIVGKYTGPTAAHAPDGLRLRYIGLLLKERRIEDAARQTESIETPIYLSLLLTDRSYAALWDHPSLLELNEPAALVARVERGVQQRLEQPVLSSSDWLETMRMLRSIGRPDEALRLGLHTLNQARGAARSSGQPLRLEVAYAYAEMGEAWAARRNARQLLREERIDKVTTRVAAAQVLGLAGDNEGALALTSALPEEGMPRPLRAVALRINACAAHGLGRFDKRDAVIEELKDIGDTAPEAYFDALLCTGRGEQAVKILGEMLEDPKTRARAILTAQLYADPIKPVNDLRDMRYRLRALVASDAVQTAIKPYGRTIALPFAKSAATAY